MIAIPIVFALIPVIWFAYQSVKGANEVDTLTKFFMFGKKFKTKSFLATLASSNSALGAVIFIFVTLGYLYGIGIFIWTFLFWLVTQKASAYCLSQIENQSENTFITNYGTLHEFLGSSFKSMKVRIAAAILSILAYLGLLSTEILIGYGVLNSLFQSNSATIFGFNLVPFLLIEAIVVFVAFYTSLTGFRAVLKTDIFQFSMIILMIGIIWVVIFLDEGSFFSSYSSVFPGVLTIDGFLNPDGSGYFTFFIFFIVANVLFWGGWWPSAMDQWHRCAATQQTSVALDKNYGTSGKISSLYFFLLTITFLVVGAVVRVNISPAGDDPFSLFTFINNLIYHNANLLNWLLASFIVLGLISALVSTVDTYSIVSTQSLISDVLIAKNYNLTLRAADDHPKITKSYLRLSRRVVLIIPIIILPAMIFINQLADIFTMVYGFFALMFALIPIIFIVVNGRHDPKKGKAAFVSIIVGGIFGIIGTFIIAYSIQGFYDGNPNLGLGALGMGIAEMYYTLYVLSPATALVSYLVYISIPRSL